MRFLKNMTHRRWRRDLSAYVDGHLEPPRREALDKHLAVCLLCQEEMAALRRMVALLHQVPQVEAPRSFALAQAPYAGLRWPVLYGNSLRYATAVAAMLLVAVVAGDLATGHTTALSPASPGVAETQSKEGPKGLADSNTTATAAPLVTGQDTTQATPSPQPLPFAASEKALETRDAAAAPSAAPGEPVTLHNWLRWAELGLGGILAALVSVVSVQWWLGRMRRQS
ncbi:MAG: zf-HC2 domain-containing protein [Dehalococcoidia bacterium]|nr:zf-HC2 domain-containing protein [Dehalococcoidia bacterium]